MKKIKIEKNKKILICLIIIVLIIAISTIIVKNNKKEQNKKTEENTVNESYVEEIEDGIKINKSTKLNETKEVGGLTISNIQLSKESGMTNLLADVTNKSNSKTGIKTLKITLLDIEGNELTTVTGIVNELEVNASTQLNISMTSDYINAYDFRVVEK